MEEKRKKRRREMPRWMKEGCRNSRWWLKSLKKAASSSALWRSERMREV